MKKNNLKPKNLWKKIPALPAGRRNPKHLSLRRSKATEAISAILLDCFASLAMTKGRAGMTKVSELGISNLGTKSPRRKMRAVRLSLFSKSCNTINRQYA